MKKLIFLIIPVFIYADDLKSLLEYATKNSDIVVSKELSQKAKELEVDSRESAYFPTIDVGAFYQTSEERTPLQSGDVYSGFAKLSFDIYDGGKKSALLDKSENEFKASSFDTASTKKSLSLQIVEDFYNIKSLQASLASRQEAQKSLYEQLQRMMKFVIAKVATSDDVDRLQAAYDTNTYEMESLKFKIISAKKNLELKVGKSIDTLDDSKFKEFEKYSLELTDNIKALMANKDALVSGADSLSSIYYPQIKIEDTYNIYGYERYDATHPKGLDDQNKLMLSLNMRLFDMGSVSKSKEAILINSQALNTQLSYSKKEQSMRYELAQDAIDIGNVKIKSAKSALVSAQSAFRTISKKYDAGIVDNIVYLDALTSQTEAKSLYEKALNDLEIAYASYYYYAGKNIEEFIK
nr:TolC family protein [uncultured Sulfurimonas sp.]